MTTIDKLDISVNNAYAIRTTMIEQINRQLRLDQAASIPPQTQVIDIYPKLAEIDLLLGLVPYHTPWAYFYPPKRFRSRRRSPFAFHRIVPTLGTLEEQEEAEERIAAYETETPEEKLEKEILLACFKMLNKINGWLGFIVGRIGQFLQG